MTVAMTRHIELLRSVARPNGNGGVGHPDSIEKILMGLSTVSWEPVFYGKKQLGVVPAKVVIGPSIWRKFTCKAFCNACCARLSLDYTPEEFTSTKHREGFALRDITVNEKTFGMYTNPMYLQELCPFLAEDVPGRGLGCAQFPWAPLSCVSAPQLKFGYFQNTKAGMVGKKPYGRAWLMKTTPQCEFAPAKLEDMGLEGDIKLLDRFIHWAEYLEINTVLPEIQQYFQNVLDRVKPIPGVSVTIATF